MDVKSAKVVILAGGKGTRFRPFSFVIPKPLMPIGEDPILLHLIKRFQQSQITRFLISTGYQSELVRAYFGNGERFGVQIKYFHEDKPLGTAGPLSLMRDEFKDDDYIFLINGDIYTELNFQELANFAGRGNHDLVVGYVEKVEKSNFGVLGIDDGQITEIIEKPERRFCISSGIYLIKGRALQQIPDNTFFTMPDLINTYLNLKRPIGAYKIEDFWVGIEDAEMLDEVLKRVEGESC
jgi:NDP-sugar pyrophosphorylase family protein